MRTFNWKSNSSRGKQLRFESLEDRSMMAGNITAEVLAGTLFLGGDSKANQVQVWQSGTNQWKVQGLGTKINGTNSIKTFNGVTDIGAILLGGNDYIRVFNGTILGTVGISDSGGNTSIKSNDIVQLSNVRANTIIVDTNDGSDNVLIDKSRALATMTVNTAQTIADGNDTVAILNSQASDLLDIFTGDGSDAVTVQGLTSPNGNLQVRTDGIGQNRSDHDSISLVKINAFATSIVSGFGADAVTISGLTGSNLELDLGSGNDVATLSQVTLTSDASIDSGDGTDVVTLTRVSATSRIFVDMDPGDNDRLTLVQCATRQAQLEGGGNPGDTLVLVQNNFDTLAFDGFQIVIGA